MGCFLACFGGSKGRKGRTPTPKALPRNTNYERHESQLPTCSFKPSAVESQLKTCSLKDPTYSLKPPTTEIQGGSILEPRERVEKTEALNSRTQKKVKFDLQDKTNSEIPFEEEPKVSTGEGRKEVGEHELEESKCLLPSGDDSTTTSISYPASHRYQNCRNGDDEDDDIDDGRTDDDYADNDDDPASHRYQNYRNGDDEDDDIDDDRTDDDYADNDNDNDDDEHGELFEWYSASSVESRTEGFSPPSTKRDAEEVDQRPTIAVGHARDRSQYVHPMLNPVENVSQWKALKSRDLKSTSLLKERKENVPSEQETLINFSSDTRQDVRLDASLSNWLRPSIALEGISEKLKDGSLCSSEIGKSRLVFGALTDEKINRMPPQGSPYQSPDGNWSKPLALDNFAAKSVSEIKGIPNTTSKYREDQRVNWYSTPFEVRLERALCEGSGES